MNTKRLYCVALVAAWVVGSVQATTYTWTQNATGTQDWTADANWAASTPFVSGAANELRFFAGTTAPANQLAAGASQVVINVPTALSMNTLTLNGIGPNSDVGSFITIGTSASTWTLGDGTTSTVSLNSALGGGGANRDLRYTIGANLTLAGNASGITTFTGGSTSGYGATFSGDIGESVAGKGITKSGTSLLVFSGNNSYTGPTLVSSGVLRLESANALPGGLGTTGGTSALTINGGVLELGATDFSRGLGAGSSQFQITGGTSGLSAYGGPRLVTVNGDASQELQWGSTHFAPTTLVLNQLYGFNAAVAPYPNGPILLANKIDLNAATRTIQIGANVAVLSGDIQTTSGTAGLTKSGGGTLVLTGNNTYNGTTTISGGTLSIGSASNLGGASANLIFNIGTLQITGTALTSLSTIDSTVTFTATRAVGFDIQDAANTFTVDQVLNQTTGTFTKSGAGTLVLNQDNTFTGATSVYGGGTLVLDYTTNSGRKLSNTPAALTLSGSRLVLKGGNYTEVVSATSLSGYTSSSLSRDGGSSKITLGAISTAENSTLAISEANLATTSSGNNAAGILAAGRVTVGSHFGCNDGANNLVAYSGYTTVTTAGGGSTAIVNELAGGGTMAANLSSYALRIVNTNNSDVLNLNNKSLQLVNNSTFLYAGGFDNNYTMNGPGTLQSASGNQYFNINVYTGCTLTVNARTSQNTGPVSKSGEGTLVLGDNNSTVSIIYVQQGVLRVNHKDGLGPTANGTIVRGGAALELANNIAIGAESLTLSGAGISNGGALRNVSGANSFGGAITLGGGGARVNCDSGSLTLSGGITTSGAQILTFGGAGNITVSNSVINGVANVVKDGAGTLGFDVTDSSVGSLCGDLTLNDSKVEISFNGAPSATVPVIKVLGDLDFVATPTIKISASVTIPKGVSYPLLTVGGTAPTSIVPNLELASEITGTLKWVGNTLFLAPPPQGTIISLQ